MIKKFKLKKFNLDGKGLEKVLGELEAKIMDYIWGNTKATVREVRDGLARQRKDLSFNSIMTIMNRLTDKGLLTKKESEGAYLYQPSVSKKDFSNLVAKDIISSVLQDSSLFSAASFTDISKDFDKKTLTKLKKLFKG